MNDVAAAPVACKTTRVTWVKPRRDPAGVPFSQLCSAAREHLRDRNWRGLAVVVGMMRFHHRRVPTWALRALDRDAERYSDLVVAATYGLPPLSARIVRRVSRGREARPAARTRRVRANVSRDGPAPPAEPPRPHARAVITPAPATFSDLTAPAVTGVPWRTLRVWLADRRVPVVRIGRRAVVSVAAFVAALDDAAGAKAAPVNAVDFIAAAAGKRGGR